MGLVREARLVEFWGPVGHAVEFSLPGGVPRRLTCCVCVHLCVYMCVYVCSGKGLGKAVQPLCQVG